MHNQQGGRQSPHPPMEREGQVEAEGLFHPLEPGGQDHLQDQDGKGQQGKAAPDIIYKDVLGLKVEGRHHQKGQQHDRQIKDDPGKFGPHKWLPLSLISGAQKDRGGDGLRRYIATELARIFQRAVRDFKTKS